MNNLSFDLIQKILWDSLTVKEISLICHTNNTINTICGKELLWKKKLSNDYGIEKKYGATWRITAQRMSEVNMINLNDRWINGQTYRELLDEALEKNWHHLYKKQIKFLELINADLAGAFFTLNMFCEKELQNFAINMLHRQFINDELSDIKQIFSRELKVIRATVLTILGSRSYLPGESYMEDDYNTKSKVFLLKLMDPILYMMQFSSFSIDDLLKIC